MSGVLIIEKQSLNQLELFDWSGDLKTVFLIISTFDIYPGGLTEVIHWLIINQGVC